MIATPARHSTATTRWPTSAPGRFLAAFRSVRIGGSVRDAASDVARWEGSGGAEGVLAVATSEGNAAGRLAYDDSAQNSTHRQTRE